MNAFAFEGLPASLIRTESGGNFRAQNDVPGAGGRGHFGRGQFSHARLQDAMRAGVIPQGTTPQQFMADPAMQERVERWHTADIGRQIKAAGLDRFIGQQIGGVPVTPEGMMSVAHLGGMGGLRRFLESGGQHNPSDAYGTSLMDYLRTHGATAGKGGHTEPSDWSSAYAAPQQQMPPHGPGNALDAPPSRQEQMVNMLAMRESMMRDTQQDPAAFMNQPQQNALAPVEFRPRYLTR